MNKLEKIKSLPGNRNPEKIIKNEISDLIIRTAYYQGSGRYTKVVNHTLEASSLLRNMNVEHVIRNDAPRGGVHGQHIIITDKYLKRLVNNDKKRLKETVNREEINEEQGLEKAKLFVKNNEQKIEDYYNRNSDKINGGLGSTQASRRLAWRFSNQANVKPSVLKDAIKDHFSKFI